MKLSEILRAGKQRIETLGWCQGDDESIWGKSGKCCAATAMTRDIPEFGAGGFFTALTNYEEAATAFRAANNIRRSIAEWNDAPERTLPEVLAAYDKAIAAAEAQEQAQ